jgi:hypothetical protein
VRYRRRFERAMFLRSLGLLRKFIERCASPCAMCAGWSTCCLEPPNTMLSRSSSTSFAFLRGLRTRLL